MIALLLLTELCVLPIRNAELVATYCLYLINFYAYVVGRGPCSLGLQLMASKILTNSALKCRQHYHE